MTVHQANQAEEESSSRMALANLPISALPLIAETIPFLSPLSSAYSSKSLPSSRSSEGDTPDNSVKGVREHVPDGFLVQALDNGDLGLSVEGRDGPSDVSTLQHFQNWVWRARKERTRRPGC
jgi:hypothetical protein